MGPRRSDRRRWWWAAAAAGAAAAILAVVLAAGLQRPQTSTTTVAPGTPGAAAAPAEPAAPTEPAVPVDIPTPDPDLDRALARDYRKALEAQGLRIAALTITDTRASGGARVVEITYRPAQARSLAALRPEVVRVLGPAANPRLALDQATVRLTDARGTVVATIQVSVPDVDRWLRTQLADDDFYRRWTVTGRLR